MARKRQTKLGHIWEDAVWFPGPDGTRTRRYVYGRTLAELAENKGRVLAERRRTVRTRRELVDDPTRWTLAELATRWMDDHVSTLTPATSEYYRIALAGRVAPYLYSARVGTLKRRDIIAWRAELVRTGVGPRSVNAAVATVKAIFGWMNDTWDDHALPNPCARIKPLDEHTRAIRVYEPEDVQAMAAAHDLRRLQRVERRRGSMNTQRASDLAARDATMTIVAGFCGLRLGELLGLQSKHYDDGRTRTRAGRVIAERGTGWLTIEQQLVDRTNTLAAVKGKRARMVPVLPTVRLALDWYLAQLPPPHDDAPLFPSLRAADPEQRGFLAGGKWRDNQFKPAARLAGFPDATPHELRHTFASLMIDRSRGRITPVRLAGWLGHRDASVTLGIYAHLYDRLEDDVLAAVDHDLFIS